jgi:hypothetical protein
VPEEQAEAASGGADGVPAIGGDLDLRGGRGGGRRAV